MRRRDLIRGALLAGVLPGTLTAGTPLAPAPGPRPRTLVLLELKGGNDGLNTLVPFRDPNYARLRPRLALDSTSLLPLDDAAALHPALRPLMPAWDDGELAWLQNVGYPAPNRSHFRSMDIWETGSDATEVLATGWLTRSLPQGSNPGVPDVVILGGDEGPARGGGLEVISLQTPEQFVRAARQLQALEPPARGPDALAHLLAVRASIRQAGVEFQASIERLEEPPLAFPSTPLGRQLQQVARMLNAGMAIPVYKVRIGSFDTHSQQLTRHAALLTQLAEALAVFRATLKQTGDWDRVLVMSYSEFGRRAAENASAGTDHGAAAPHFALGGRVKGGLYGTAPDLTTLDRGDPVQTTDYRQLYATIAERWWRQPAPAFQTRFPVMEWI
ncbi:hypothetical protein CKO25_18225 [Thiocapsa imhoffii]|uniref:DUF1501 domain-containing protein n=1 Tax=Thiocapsa imhoffii TaxID=382777 RepID=A0A9X0WKS0_9GAMM|nr:DUF1501 domain-containing protein [Thiocapsa imhoffii]MBK1646546.1 hypothetical protein [Thiocapsa imhoffii]